MDDFKKLYDVLVSEGKFTKSYDEFQSLWLEDEEYKNKVYEVVKEDGLFTKEKDSFLEKYSLTPQKKNPIEEEEPLESISEDVSMDTTEESGVGEESNEVIEESQGNSITNSYLRGSTLGIVNTPQEVSEEDAKLSDDQAAAKRSRTGDTGYPRYSAKDLGVTFKDAFYNAFTNQIPAQFKTTWSLNPKTLAVEDYTTAIDKAEAEGLDYAEIEETKISSGLGGAPAQPSTRKIVKVPLDEAKKRLALYRKGAMEDLVDISLDRAKASKFINPNSKLSDGINPKEFMALVGGQLPVLGASVMPVIGSGSIIYGDIYMENLTAIAAQKNKVEEQDVTPSMMMDIISKGEDEKAIALTGAAIATSLDLIGLGKAFNIIKGPATGLIRDAVKKGISKGGRAGAIKAVKIAGNVLTAGAVEYGTEALQGVTSQVSKELALGRTAVEAFQNVDFESANEEGLAGLVMGGGMATTHTPTFSSKEVDAMIEENDLGGLKEFTEGGLIDWKTIPEKTKAKVNLTTETVGDKTYSYPSGILGKQEEAEVDAKVEVDVKEDVDIEEQVNEQTTTDPTGVPSVDEGAEPNVDQVDAEAGLTAEESTNQKTGLKATAPWNVDENENFTGEKYEVVLSVVDSEGDRNPSREEMLYEIRVSVKEKDGVTRLKNNLTKVFDTAEEAKAYANKNFIDKDPVNNRKESTNQQSEITIEDISKTSTRVSDPNKVADEITQEDVDYAAGQIELGVLNWDGNPMTMRVDLGIERADVRKGEADIKRGKPNSAPAKRLIGALREAKERGQYDFFSGSGSNISRQNVPINEKFLGEEELTQAEIDDINSKDAELETRYNNWFNALDEESQNEILEDYEKNNSGEISSDAQSRESQENVPNREERLGDEERNAGEPREAEKLEGYQDLIFELQDVIETQENVNEDPDVPSRDVDEAIQEHLDQSDVYQNATDIQRESIFRDAKQLQFKDIPSAPSAREAIRKDIKKKRSAELKAIAQEESKELEDAKKIKNKTAKKEKTDDVKSIYSDKANEVKAKWDAELNKLKAPPSTTITMSETTGLKKQIKTLSRGARMYKGALVEKKAQFQQFIKDLPWANKLTIKQTKALLNGFNRTDLLNEKAVAKYMKFTERVLADRAFADSVIDANKKRKTSARNIKKKLGTLPNSFEIFKALFSVDVNLIPVDLLDSYLKLNKRFSERSTVLDVGEISKAANEASEILNAIDTEQNEAGNMRAKFDEYIELNPQGDKSFSETIAAMVKDKEITAEEAVLMKNYKTIIDPKEAPSESEIAQTQAEKEAEDQAQRADDIKTISTTSKYRSDGKSITSDIANKHERETAQELLELSKDKSLLEELTSISLSNLVKTIKAIKGNILPTNGKELRNQLAAIKKGKEVNDVIDGLGKKSTITKIRDFFGNFNVSSWRDAIVNPTLRRIRSRALENIDQTIGNTKNKKVFDNVFGSFARAFSGYTTEAEKINEKSTEAVNLLSSDNNKNDNAIVKAKYRLWAYGLQREFESNPGSKKVFSAQDAIAQIFKYGVDQENLPSMSKNDLKLFVEEFGDNASKTADQMYNELTAKEKKVAAIIREVNDNLSEKTMFNGAMNQGNRPEHFENYVHHQAMQKKGEDAPSLDDNINSSFSDGTSKERNSQVKPLMPDPILSMQLGAKATLKDFHLTNEVKIADGALKRANYKYKAAEFKGTNEREKAQALRDAFAEVVMIIKEGENKQNNSSSRILNGLEELGYYSILASAPRAVAELGTNLAYVMTANAEEYTVGLAKYSDLYMGVKGKDVMHNSGSYQTTKNYGKSVSGKFADGNTFLDQDGGSKSEARSDVANKAKQIANHIQLKTAVKTISGFLLSTPDRMVSRPLWFGSYAAEFKRQTKTKVDFDKIAENDAEYMAKFKEGIDKATAHADNEVKQSSTTNNKALGILKLKNRASDNAFISITKRADKAMISFMLYEFETAATAINIMMKKGLVNQAKGSRLMAAVGLRMALYTPLVTATRGVFNNALSSALGEEDEKEQEEQTAEMYARSGLGSIISLTLGRRMGNLGRIPLALTVEHLNENYLQGLRNGEEYDSFKHGLMYQSVTSEDLSRKNKLAGVMLTKFTGAYAPFFKAGLNTTTAVNDLFSDKKISSEDKFKRADRAVMESLGVLGFIPFYKDVKSYRTRNDYVTKPKQKPRNTPKNFNY